MSDMLQTDADRNIAIDKLAGGDADALSARPVLCRSP